MAIDQSTEETMFTELSQHIDHEIVCVTYRGWNVAIECETCGCVLFNANRLEPTTGETP